LVYAVSEKSSGGAVESKKDVKSSAPDLKRRTANGLSVARLFVLYAIGPVRIVALFYDFALACLPVCVFNFVRIT